MSLLCRLEGFVDAPEFKRGLAISVFHPYPACTF